MGGDLSRFIAAVIGRPVVTAHAMHAADPPRFAGVVRAWALDAFLARP